MAISNSLDGILRLQRALENAMTSDWFGATTTAGGTFPPINVFQNGEGYVAIAELPGVQRDDIKIEVNRNKLRLSGTKSIDYGETISMHRVERSRGSFDRTLTLPFEVGEDIQAEYRDGMLALRLPPAESHKTRTVKIN